MSDLKKERTKIEKIALVLGVTVIAAVLLAVPINTATITAEARQVEKIVFLDHGKNSHKENKGHNNLHSTSHDPCGEGSNRFAFIDGKISWSQTPVAYYIDMSNFVETESVNAAQAEDAIVASFNTWENEIRPRGPLFVQVFDPSEAQVDVSFGSYDGQDGVVGVTAVTYVTQSHEIIQASVLLDSDDSWFIGEENTCTGSGTSFDIQSVATHEVGHVLGLDHVDDPQLTMYPYVTTGETLKRTLGLGDARGLGKLY